MLSHFSRVQLFVTLWTVAHQAPLSMDTGLGCHFLLWAIFPTQESNLCLLHLLYWQVDSWPLHHCRPDTALMQHRVHRILPDLTTSSLFPDTGLANGSFRFSRRCYRKLNKLFGQPNTNITAGLNSSTIKCKIFVTLIHGSNLLPSRLLTSEPTSINKELVKMPIPGPWLQKVLI